MSRVAQIAIVVALLLIWAIPASPKVQAQWTVMVFMNADNNLEPYALEDFREIAKVGSTDEVHVIVQIDRIGKYTLTDSEDPQWSDTLRFRVEKGQEPVPQFAVHAPGEQNMGDPEHLWSFISWAMSQYPAEKYALILWDHGAGYRSAQVQSGLNPPMVLEPEHRLFLRPRAAAHKAISLDETSNDELYNREIQDLLESRLPRPFELIGFDACLMAMLETSYAMRRSARKMVGSEELEPAWGWAYDLFLGELIDHPQWDADDLATAIVRAYEARYSAVQNLDPTTTLSAFDLDRTQAIADELSRLVDGLIANMDVELNAIRDARDECRPLANKSDFHHVDLVHFLEKYAARTQDANLRRRALALASLTRSAVIANFAGAERNARSTAFGSNGVAIYFPKSGTAYRNDYREDRAYQKGNTKYPIAFVSEQRWSEFLHLYFTKRPH